MDVTDSNVSRPRADISSLVSPVRLKHSLVVLCVINQALIAISNSRSYTEDIYVSSGSERQVLGMISMQISQ